MQKVYQTWRKIVAIFFGGNAALALAYALITSIIALVLKLPFWPPAFRITGWFGFFTKSSTGFWFFACVFVMAVGYYVAAFALGTGAQFIHERVNWWLFRHPHDRDVWSRIETQTERYKVIGAIVGIAAVLVVVVALLVASSVDLYDARHSQLAWILFWPGISLFMGVPLVALLRYAEKTSLFSAARFRRFLLSRCFFIANLLVVIMVIVAIIIPLLYSGLNVLGQSVFIPLLDKAYASAQAELETHWDEILQEERFHPAGREQELRESYWDAMGVLDIESIMAPNLALALKFGAQLLIVPIVLLFLVPLLAFQFRHTLWFILFALLSFAVGELLDFLLANVFKVARGTWTAIILAIGFILLNEFVFDSLEEEITEHEAYCQACSAEIGAGDRYCRACGAEQRVS